jgi:hypothetical protein
MVLKMKLNCPKCGGRSVSNVTSRLPLKGGGLQTTNKQWPEPHNDDPPDKFVRPMTDFNHPFYCNSCGYYFGGGFGGAV